MLPKGPRLSNWQALRCGLQVLGVLALILLIFAAGAVLAGWLFYNLFVYGEFF